MESIYSKFLSLNRRDLVNGLVMAVGSAVFAYLAQLLNAPGFDYASIQWDLVLKVGVSAGIMYIGKNLFTTSDGKVFGFIG